MSSIVVASTFLPAGAASVLVLERAITASTTKQWEKKRHRVRIVFEHTSGPKKGLFEIIGRLDTVNPEKPDLTVGDLPAFSELLGASLVAVKRSYVFYRGLIIPEVTNKHFNPSQR